MLRCLNNKRNWILMFGLLGLLAIPKTTWSHEGHDEGTPSAGNVVGGKITLSSEAKENIGLKVIEVEEEPIDEIVKSFGMVTTDPNKTADVSSRISGRVLKLLVNIGDEVEKDQELVQIESRQIGNPPPVVTLKSPIAGVVIHRDLRLGETVEPDKHLFEIADLGEVLIESEIYEEDIAKIKVGQKARIKLPVAYPEEVFDGDVFYMSPTLDPEKRTADLWIRVPNAEKKLKPGMLAQVAIIIKEKKKAVAIPKDAVVEEGGEKFVYLEEGDSFKRQPISLGFSNDGLVEIKRGLIPGDRIVTTGNYELRMTELTAIRKSPEEKKKSTKKAK